MNLRNKQFYRIVFEIIFQNPEAAKGIFLHTEFSIDGSQNEYLQQIIPLVNYVCEETRFDVDTALNIADRCLTDETLISIFQATIVNNIYIDGQGCYYKKDSSLEEEL